MTDIFTVYRNLDPIPPVLVRFTYGRGRAEIQQPVVFTRSWGQTRLLPEGIPHCQLEDQQPLWIGAHPMLNPETGPALVRVAMWLPSSPSFAALMDLATLGLCTTHMNAGVEFFLPRTDEPLTVTAVQLGFLCLDAARLGLPDELAADLVVHDLKATF